MRTIAVLQNTDSEHLGLIEDHLEGRNIRFKYIRPSHDANWQAKLNQPKDGLILLGATPYGTVSAPKTPLLEAKIECVESCLNQQIPLLAFSTGLQILSLAIGGSVMVKEPSTAILTANRSDESVLNGYLPESYPVVYWMRDLPLLPSDSRVLSKTEDGQAMLYQTNENSFGFVGHPGIKTAMIEDSIVQIPEHNFVDVNFLTAVRQCQNQIEQSLISMMAGIIKITGWMR